MSPSSPPHLEPLRRIGHALERATPTALSPSLLLETLVRELPCATASIHGASAEAIASHQSEGPPPLLALDLTLPGNYLRLRFGFRELSATDTHLPLLEALVPWLALLLRKPTQLTLEPLLSRVSAEWSLSRAQQRVLRLVARGCSNKDIASELACHIKTVEAHMTAILTRSGISSRSELLSHLLARLTTG